MPLSHRRLAAWYVQLAQQLEAGLPLAEAVRGTRGTGAPDALVAAMAGTVEAGGSSDDALVAAGRWLPHADQLTLSAAAEAGRMPQLLRLLAQRHAELHAATIRVVLACLYPLAILHLGLLLLPLMRMIDWQKGFEWSAIRYVTGVAATVLPLWALVTLVVVLVRRENPIVRAVGGRLPAIGAYLRNADLANLAFTLGNFLEAGVPVGQAWAAAGLVSRSPRLRASAAALAAVVDRGRAPGPELVAQPCFPPDFVAQYRNGETTGQLEAALLRLAGQHQDAANRALTVATFLYPALMFLLVAGMVAYGVFTIYAGYLKMITDLAH